MNRNNKDTLRYENDKRYGSFQDIQITEHTLSKVSQMIDLDEFETEIHQSRENIDNRS